jgi:hypothetical protein
MNTSIKSANLVYNDNNNSGNVNNPSPNDTMIPSVLNANQQENIPDTETEVI